MDNDAPATRRDVGNVITLIQQLAERMDHRLERINDTLFYIQNQMGALTRWADRTERSQGALEGTQTAQQRAIDDLASRVTRLEQRLG